MSIPEDIQKLVPGNIVTLFEVNGSEFGAGVLRFHAHKQATPIVFQGLSYSPWPVEATGFARTSDQPPKPRLRVGNVNGVISLICAAYQDMVGAVVTRRRTFKKYLDAVNFPEGNPTADPNEEFPPEVWYIERKSHEDNEYIEFELSSAMDFNGVLLPRRQIIANHCPWVYRSADCGYTGGPVAKSDDTPTSDPAQDSCGKRLSSCKLRFGQNSELPFGGFPAASLMRT